MDSDVRESIRAIVEYDWATEERDYHEQPEEDRAGHVFEHLRRVREWLDAA